MAVNLVLLSHGAQNGTTSSSAASQQTPPKLTISAMDLSTPGAAAAAGAAADFLNQRRRERFVFRPNHLEILEKHFQEDSYPSFEKREEMARACNAATESLTGRPLGDKEVVTAQIVSNWFANKRKEMKKLAREEGLDLSQVPLRPRGRPCRFFGELMTQIQDNSRDGNSAEVEAAINGHLQEAQTLMQQEVPSPTVPEEEVVTVIPRAPEETAAEEAAAANSNPTPDERALSLSVELAAVNQAILSLTGQQPLGMKSAAPAAAAANTPAAAPATPNGAPAPEKMDTAPPAPAVAPAPAPAVTAPAVTAATAVAAVNGGN